MRIKEEIRKSVLKSLYSIDKLTLLKRSEVLCKKLLNSELYQSCKSVSLYMKIRGEPELKDIIVNSHRLGKRVFIPRLLKKHQITTDNVFSPLGSMRFDEMYHGYNENKFKQSNFGTLELEMSHFWDESIKCGGVDLFIVPGVAFTREGKRLGRGGGHFDKYLANYAKVLKQAQGIEKRVFKIALAFSEQILEDIPTDEHDINVDFVITDD